MKKVIENPKQQRSCEQSRSTFFMVEINLAMPARFILIISITHEKNPLIFATSGGSLN